MRTRLKKGYTQIYTGDGKGKTTAAFGLALRASGHGLKTYIGQFMKGQHYGEHDAFSSIPLVTIELYGKDTFIHIDRKSDEDVAMANRGLVKARTAMLSDEYDIIILDEVLVAIHFGLLSLKQIIGFIDEKPDTVELILTGRRAPAQLIEKADLVTEMKEIKHYYQTGVQARDGIER
ncbi:cob(I)yrinic acid a,c-diamide adenosyltransferase [candidate division KSB1 bacterium]|nr:cob(I)yrinic acid a,c-diamide adenosyltransferase [candidate division KSB1 bacterium]